ncbi:MAG: class 1 fructose-bisphosphatase [Rhodothermales bacterium]|nr:class 1 fructose-bisphosphatase [Rhodothermales bacterium]
MPAPQHTLSRFKTLEQFILEREDRIPVATGAFSRLIRDLSIAAKVVNSYIRQAGLLDVLGDTGETNVQGEVQQQLDAIAHDEFLEALRLGGESCLIVSEEADEIIPVQPRTGAEGRYIVLLDPLDGSSNIDVNVSVGTIFSLYRLPDGAEPGVDAALQPGTEQVAAGYVIYGSSTMFVFTSGDGVNGFTLDPAVGEFLLSHPDLKIPPSGRFYSIDEGNAAAFEEGLERYLHWLEYEQEQPSTYKTRYIGSFITDFHRNLLKGGIYMYPATAVYPEGKLRLMYEANPMAFICEQAGGTATDGHRRILDIEPEALHQRTALYIGSPEMVRRAEAFLRGDADAGRLP